MREYFGELMVNRQRLLWTIATRRQLERWEPYVAANAVRNMAGRKLDSADIWSAQIEHHFALVAARHLLLAIELEPASGVSIDSTMRAELIEGRHLHEHWLDNLPVFNISPRVEEPPFSSGRSFAKRNTGQGPWPDGEAWEHVEEPLSQVRESRGQADKEVAGGGPTASELETLEQTLSTQRTAGGGLSNERGFLSACHPDAPGCPGSQGSRREPIDERGHECVGLVSGVRQCL